MSTIRKMTLDGNLHDVVELPFEVIKEAWSEYSLLDGGRLRVRNVLVRAFQVIDAAGKPQLSPDGDPVIIRRPGHQDQHQSREAMDRMLVRRRTP